MPTSLPHLAGERSVGVRKAGPYRFGHNDELIGIAMRDRAEAAFLELRASKAIPDAYRTVLIDGKGDVVQGEASGTEVLWRGGRASREWLDTARASLADLEWVHSDAVGVESLPLQELAASGVTLTNGAGNFSRPMAEWVILAMLTAAKDLAGFVRKSDTATWDPNPQLSELESAVVLLLGLGSVGSLVAEMGIPFGLDVRAAVRTQRDLVPPGVSRLVEGDSWRDELDQADFVVACLPLTPATRHCLDEAAFGALKPGAWLINVARGPLVDEKALTAALESGKLGGAILDSFEEEPLPASSPLWGRSNVICLPHHTWSSRQAGERALTLWATQLGRWASGDALEHIIDIRAGY